MLVALLPLALLGDVQPDLFSRLQSRNPSFPNDHLSWTLHVSEVDQNGTGESLDYPATLNFLPDSSFCEELSLEGVPCVKLFEEKPSGEKRIVEPLDPSRAPWIWALHGREHFTLACEIINETPGSMSFRVKGKKDVTALLEVDQKGDFERFAWFVYEGETLKRTVEAVFLEQVKM